MMRNIVLTGFMGTGKSAVGRRLAKALGWRFVDTDEMIERKTGRTIPQIFEKYGERYFRNVERKMIRIAARQKNAVIATGGGAVLDPRNVRVLSGNGLLVGLKASSRAILSRVSGSDRPLLRGGDPRSRVEALLAARQERYGRADFIVDTSGRDADQVSRRILAFVKSGESDVVRVDLAGRGYDIRIGNGNLPQLGPRLAKLGCTGRVGLVTNPRIHKLYGPAVSRSLVKAGYRTHTMIVPEGERYKSLEWASRLYDSMIEKRFERGSTLVALGGGVIGDLAGFAAGTFLRGINVVQVPTTLAAQVDASIGGKTAVNHPSGKNLIGVFHQPRLVWIDTRVLRTLSEREYRSGIAEVIKYGIIADAEFFGFLEDNMGGLLRREDGIVRMAVRRSCEIKGRVVREDERESGLRRILNYGHTLGHALETASGYRRYLHGEAVAIGMAFSARLAKHLGMCSGDTLRRQLDLIKRAGLSVSLPKTRPADILKNMKLDKKVKGEAIHFVLADRIGHVGVKPVSPGDIIKVLRLKQKEDQGE
jgi:shikimate kinase/3-dehydroquinate synthase